MVTNEERNSCKGKNDEIIRKIRGYLVGGDGGGGFREGHRGQHHSKPPETTSAKPNRKGGRGRGGLGRRKRIKGVGVGEEGGGGVRGGKGGKRRGGG